MSTDRVSTTGLLSSLLIAWLAADANADHFTYVDQDGETVEIEARLAGSGQGAHALELADGRMRIVPQAAVTKRVPAASPEPATADEIVAQLRAKFTPELFRAHQDGEYVIGLVLAAPLEKRAEVRAKGFLRKAGRFFQSVEGVFLDFVEDAGVEIQRPTHPLVVLIFETDDGFEKHAAEETQGRGLSAGVMAGYYSELTNHLVIRMSECHTFEVPLHEAVHQQVYNRGILRRLSGAPAWFNEGIATGFEANGERINIGPMKVSPHYARLALAARAVDWAELIGNDRAFRGDVLAGEGYAHAWSLHWFLATKYDEQYAEFVKLLGSRAPLEESDPQRRAEEFARVFGKRAAELQREFPQALQTALKRQKVSLLTRERPGVSLTQSNLAEVQMTAVRRADRGGALQVQGRVKNISLIRPMSFHIAVVTESGTYADWIVPNLATLRTSRLKPQYARKVVPNAPGGPGRTFAVQVRAAVPGSALAEQWEQGEAAPPALRR